MKNKKGTSLLKIDNFLVETDKINSSDETFNKLMFLYSAALKQLETKMDILKEEFNCFYGCSIIDHTQTRIKKPESIIKKMEDKKYEKTYRNLVEQINDIAGLRVICPIKDNVFTIVDLVKNMPDVNVIKEKDYITKPKKKWIFKLSYDSRNTSTFNETDNTSKGRNTNTNISNGFLGKFRAWYKI